MQTIGQAAPSHHPAGKLIDQNNFIVAHDIVFIASEEFVCPQALIDMMHNCSAFRIIKRLAFRQNFLLAQNLLQPFVTLI